MGQSAPALAHGADDIFWVNQLHTALHSKGYHPGDEEMEVWLFGEQTLSALLTFQVMLPHQYLLNIADIRCSLPS